MLETNISSPEKPKVGLSTPRLVCELTVWVCVSGMQLLQVPHYSVLLGTLAQGAAAVGVQGGPWPAFLNSWVVVFFFKGNSHFLRGRLK